MDRIRFFDKDLLANLIQTSRHARTLPVTTSERTFVEAMAEDDLDLGMTICDQGAPAVAYWLGKESIDPDARDKIGCYLLDMAQTLGEKDMRKGIEEAARLIVAGNPNFVPSQVHACDYVTSRLDALAKIDPVAAIDAATIVQLYAPGTTNRETAGRHLLGAALQLGKAGHLQASLGLSNETIMASRDPMTRADSQTLIHMGKILAMAVAQGCNQAANSAVLMVGYGAPGSQVRQIGERSLAREFRFRLDGGNIPETAIAARVLLKAGASRTGPAGMAASKFLNDHYASLTITDRKKTDKVLSGAETWTDPRGTLRASARDMIAACYDHGRIYLPARPDDPLPNAGVKAFKHENALRSFNIDGLVRN